MSANNKTIPSFNLNVPGGGLQQSVTVPGNVPIYSSYTGKPIWTGPMPYGIHCDAPSGTPNHGKKIFIYF